MRKQFEEEYFLKLKKNWKNFKLSTASYSSAKKAGLTTLIDHYIATKWAREFRYLIVFVKKYYEECGEDYSLFLEKYPEVSIWEKECHSFELEYEKEENSSNLSHQERIRNLKFRIRNLCSGSD